MEKERKINLKPYVISAIVSVIIAGGFFCLFFFTNGRGLQGACDGFGFTGIILICLSGLIYVYRNGFFDIFSYGFKQLGSSMFNKKANKYKDFADYKEQGNVIRKKRSNYYIVTLLLGLAFIVAAVGFLIAYRAAI